MIHEVLKCVEEDINAYFRIKLPNSVHEKKVILSNIVNQDGTIAIHGSDKVILSLYNIEKEPAANSVISSGMQQSLNLNIYIIFSAYFSSSNYEQALMFISYIMGYFQNKNVYTRSNTPMLRKIDANIEKLVFEICTLNTEQANSVWASLGAKLMPFVMYKVRTISIDESIIREYRPSISGISDNHKKGNGA